jgi:hypothetical protein
LEPPVIDNTDIVINMFIKAQSNAEEVLRATAKAAAEADAQMNAAQKSSVMASGSASPSANSTFAIQQKAAAREATLAMGQLSQAIRTGEKDLTPYIARVQSTRATLQTFTEAESRAQAAVGITSKQAEASAAGWSTATSKMKLFELGTAGVIGITTDMAVHFQKSMEMVHTQAGAPQTEVDALSGKIIDLSNHVATGPNSLADSLYHAESAGFRMAAALDIVKASAQGANVGNSDLESTTQAVIAVMSSQIDGVKNASDAMAYLNGIVGIGDMRMQGLTEALSTGILPTFKTAGLTIKDFGAALAVLTDNATPPVEAATRLRMTVALLAAPSGAASKALQAVGFSAAQANAALAHRSELEQYGVHLSQLSADLRQPNGLLVALEDLKSHLNDSGLTATEQAAVITRAFGGGRSSGAIQTLLEELDKLKSKYGDLGASASKFGGDVAANQKTMDYQLKQAKASSEALSIALGQGLAPAETEVLNALTPLLQDMAAFTKAHQDVTSAVLLGAGALGGLALTIKAGKGLWALGTESVGLYQKAVELAGIKSTAAVPEIAAAGTAAEVSGAEAQAASYKWDILGTAIKGATIVGLIYAGASLANTYVTQGQQKALEEATQAYIKGTLTLKQYHEVVAAIPGVNQQQADALVSQDRALQGITPTIDHTADAWNRLTQQQRDQAKASLQQAEAFSKVSGAMGGVDALGIFSGGTNKQSTPPFSSQVASSQLGLGDPQTEYAGLQKAMDDLAYKVVQDQQIFGRHAQETQADIAAYQAARAKFDAWESDYTKLTAAQGAYAKSLKTQPLDELQAAQSRLSKLESAAADEFFKTGSILPDTQAKITATNTEIAKFQKALAGAQTPTDAMTAAQKRLQVATTAAYADFDRYHKILPQHAQEIIADTDKINAMNKAVSNLTSKLTADPYQAKLAEAQKHLTEVSNQLAEAYATGNRPAIERLTAEYDKWSAKVTGYTTDMAKATGQWDPWAAKMQASQTAVTQATDKYLWDKNILDLHGQALQADLKRIDEETKTYKTLEKASNAAAWALNEIAKAGKPQPVGNADIPGLHQNQSLAGGGGAGSGTPATPEDNATWWAGVLQKVNNSLGSGGPFSFGSIGPNAPTAGGGTTYGGNHFGIPSTSQIDQMNQTAIQDKYAAREQAEQDIIDGLKHQSIIIGQDTSLTADQRKIDQDILQIKMDRKQTQIDLAKLEALQKDPKATPAQIAAAKETVANDKNKTTEDKGQLTNDQYQAGINALQTKLTEFSTEQQTLSTIAQDQLTVTTDVGNLQVQKLAAVVTAIQDGTAVIQATSAVDSAKSNAATTAITDQTAIMAATYKALQDSVTAQRAIDADIRNGDTAKEAIDERIAAAQQAVDRDGIAIVQAEAQRDREVAKEQIQIAQDGVTIAKDKAAADAAADAWQRTTLQDQLGLDQAKLSLQEYQNQLTADSNTILNAINSKAGNGFDYTAQISADVKNVSAASQDVQNWTAKIANDQTLANVSAAGWSKLEANDAQQQAIDQALLAATQGNWGQAIALLQQQQEVDSEALGTAQDSLNTLQDMRQIAQQQLQIQEIGNDFQKAALDHQKNMIDLNGSLTQDQKDKAKAQLNIQEDQLQVSTDQLKLQEVIASGGTQTDILQAQLTIQQDAYKLQEDQYGLSQLLLKAAQDSNSVAALQAMIKILQGLLRQQNLPIATSRRSGSTLRNAYGQTAASAGANRGTR